jgi:hypothetical protein
MQNLINSKSDTEEDDEDWMFPEEDLEEDNQDSDDSDEDW